MAGEYSLSPNDGLMSNRMAEGERIAGDPGLIAAVRHQVAGGGGRRSVEWARAESRQAYQTQRRGARVVLRPAAPCIAILDCASPSPDTLFLNGETARL